MKQDKELDRMMELAGMKPAKKTTSKKENLNESVVGIGAINSPFMQREKSDYELAFEHYMNGEANAKTSLIEDLEAENALLREIIEQHLTEEEINEIISLFGKKKKPTEAEIKNKYNERMKHKDAGMEVLKLDPKEFKKGNKSKWISAYKATVKRNLGDQFLAYVGENKDAILSGKLNHFSAYEIPEDDAGNEYKEYGMYTQGKGKFKVG